MANPITTDSPIGFFTNVASRLLSAELNLDLHRIQIYPTNQYTPAVHRLLQVTANLYDATTTNVYPSVFRPLFSRDQNGLGTNLFVSGYTNVFSVSGPDDLQFILPVNAWDLANTNIPFVIMPVNVYGVPWIIGAKKGIPNFNEFYMESAFQLSRKIMVTRSDTNVTMYTTFTNYEMFSLSLSNHFGVECWNSYRSNYTRPLNIYASDDLTMTLTNDENFSFTTNLFATGLLQFPNSTNAVWPGHTNSINPFLSPGSFQIPLQTNFVAVPLALYRFSGGAPFLTTNLALPFEMTDTGFGQYPQPHWGLTMTNNLRVIMVDTGDPDNWQVIDYVQLAGPCSFRDLTTEILNGYDTVAQDKRDTGYNNQWDTNVINGIPAGIWEQLNVSQGLGIPTYKQGQNGWNQSQKLVYDQINGFLVFMNGANTPLLVYPGYVPDPNIIGIAEITNAMQAPYMPTATVVQDIVWQANDPQVHYMAGDLSNPNAGNGLQINFNWPGNLGRLNFRYQPWSGNPATGIGTNLLAIKDPLVTCSDNWDFPDGQSMDISRLGRVHRGTPWQTVYLKAPDILSYSNNFGNFGTNGANVWVNWTGDTDAINAAAMAPAQDWHLASLLASMLNTNDLRSLFSVNNPDPNAWLALFDGLTALTNNLTDAQLPFFTPPQFGVIVISSNSPQASIIADAIETARTSRPGQLFNDVGDILATPQLTVNSPFLNWNDNVQQQRGISDEAYEIIPSQLLPLLRADSIGSVAAANGQLVIQFTGYDGHSYAIEVSSNLADWTSIATNSPADGVFSFTNLPTLNPGPQFFRSILLN